MIKLLSSVSNWKFIIPVFLLFCYFTFFLFPNQQTQLTKIAGEQISPLDTRFSYSLQEVNYLFENLGIEGRELYATIVGSVDMIYPIVYGILFMLVLVFLLRKLSGHKSKLILIALLPVLGSLFDYFENFHILKLLQKYPTITEQDIVLSEQFTRLKHIILFSSLGIVLAASVILLLKFVTKRKDKREKSEGFASAGSDPTQHQQQ